MRHAVRGRNTPQHDGRLLELIIVFGNDRACNPVPESRSEKATRLQPARETPPRDCAAVATGCARSEGTDLLGVGKADDAFDEAVSVGRGQFECFLQVVPAESVSNQPFGANMTVGN